IYRRESRTNRSSCRCRKPGMQRRFTMARSARQRKAPTRRSSNWQGAALAVGGLISSNPVLVGGSTAFLVTLFYVSANALWYQPFPHRNAFFAKIGRAHV